MKKLYEVEIELHMYVMAENESEAISVAQRNVKDEADNLSDFDFAANRTTCCYANWENEYPYGADTNDTVGEILKLEKEAAIKQVEREKWEKKQRKLPGF